MRRRVCQGEYPRVFAVSVFQLNQTGSELKRPPTDAQASNSSPTPRPPSGPHMPICVDIEIDNCTHVFLKTSRFKRRAHARLV